MQESRLKEKQIKRNHAISQLTYRTDRINRQVARLAITLLVCVVGYFLHRDKGIQDLHQAKSHYVMHQQTYQKLALMVLQQGRVNLSETRLNSYSKAFNGWKRCAGCETLSLDQALADVSISDEQHSTFLTLMQKAEILAIDHLVKTAGHGRSTYVVFSLGWSGINIFATGCNIDIVFLNNRPLYSEHNLPPMYKSLVREKIDNNWYVEKICA